MSVKNKLQCRIFRTSLQNEKDVKRISDKLNKLSGIVDWSVDLEDWEKVLRIECMGIESEQIARLLKDEGVYISELSTQEI